MLIAFDPLIPPWGTYLKGTPVTKEHVCYKRENMHFRATYHNNQKKVENECLTVRNDRLDYNTLTRSKIMSRRRGQ